VALSVADATTAVQEAHRLAAPASAIERRATELLETLEPRAQAMLKKLLEEYRNDSGPARLEAEEGLLDFFLSAEDADEDDDSDEEPL